MVRTIKPKIQFRPRRISTRGSGERTQNRNPERSNPKMFEAKVDPMNAEKTAKLNRNGPWNCFPPSLSPSLVRSDLASGSADFARDFSEGSALAVPAIGTAEDSSLCTAEGSSLCTAEGSVGTAEGSSFGTAEGSVGTAEGSVGTAEGSVEVGEDIAGGGGTSR